MQVFGERGSNNMQVLMVLWGGWEESTICDQELLLGSLFGRGVVIGRS